MDLSVESCTDRGNRNECDRGSHKLLFRLGAGVRLAASASACAAASAATSTTAGVLVDRPALAFDPLGGRFRHRPILVALGGQRHLDGLVALVAVVRQ